MNWDLRIGNVIVELKNSSLVQRPLRAWRSSNAVVREAWDEYRAKVSFKNRQKHIEQVNARRYADQAEKEQDLLRKYDALRRDRSKADAIKVLMERDRDLKRAKIYRILKKHGR